MPRTRENIKAESYSPWCAMAIMHLERRGMNNAELAKITRNTQFTIHAHLTGKVRPNPQVVEAMAEAFGLSGSERESFILEAHLAHAPEEIRAYINQLRRQVKDLTVKAAAVTLKSAD
jgi:restriction endonuclease Mrr